MPFNTFHSKRSKQAAIRAGWIVIILSCLLPIAGWAQNLSRPNIAAPGGLQVNSYTGSLHYQRTDMMIPGRGLSLDITFSYNSADRRIDHGYGYGWTFVYNVFYKDSAGGILLQQWDGRRDYYTRQGNTFLAPAGIFDKLTGTPGNYVLTTKEGVSYFFENSSHKKLTRITDPNGNAIVLAYSGSQLLSITDASARTILFSRNSSGRLSEIRSEAATPAHFVRYNYDNAGNMTAIADAKQQVIGYGYGADRVMTSLTDANRNEVKITYTVNNAVREIISCLARKSIAYNPDNGTVAVADQTNGRTLYTTYLFDSRGRLAQRTGNCCGFNTSYKYDNENNITGIIDARGQRTTYGYDAIGNLIAESDPLGNTAHYTYEGPYNRLSRIRDKRGHTTRFTYDSRGNLVRKTLPLNIVQEYTYDNHGNLTGYKDGRGNSTTYVPDNYGYLRTTTDQAGTTTQEHDAWGNLILITDPNGHTTTYKHDAINQLIEVKDARNQLTKYEYDGNGNEVTTTDANNRTTRYAYDAYDNLTYLKNAKEEITLWNYDGAGNRLSMTTPKGHTTQYTYDNLNRLTGIRNALGETTGFAYDPNGNRIMTAYPNGNTVNVAYDAVNRPERISDNLGLLIAITYDANGNVLTKTNAAGNTTSLRYDALNRLIASSDPTGSTAQFDYDENNNLVKKTDRNGQPEQYYYDAVNRLSRVVNALNKSTSYTYDKKANVETITDARNNKTQYQYDELDRKVTETFADNTSRHFEYDKVGNLLLRTDGKGVITSYTYDELNRVKQRQYPGSTETFDYDAEGRLWKAVNSHATVEFTYDPVGRQQAEKLNGKLTTYIYNIALRSKTIVYPSGRSIERATDARGQLQSIKDGPALIAELTYNNAGQQLTRRLANGLTNTFTYSSKGEIKDNRLLPAHTEDVQYSYDKESNPRSAQPAISEFSAEQYGYDATNRLTTFSNTSNSQSFDYDAVGNRSTATINGVTYAYTPNTMNAYSGITGGGNTINPTYDANGNTTADGSHTYSFDYENRLQTVDGGSTATYKYDALGRRIQKTTAAGTVNYYFDGLQVIEEQDGLGQLQASFVWGTWIDELLQLTRNNQAYYYHTNLVGSVTAITDAGGSLVERYTYDAFGQRTIYNSANAIIPQSQAGNTHGFTGQQLDTETGLYYYRSRHYNATHGRFIQRDPLGYRDGMGLYAYVNNRPSRFIDPLGTEGIDWCMTDAEWDDLQNTLSWLGLIPGIGMPFDLVNAGIYVYRGDYANAALSGIAFIPVLGDFYGGARQLYRHSDEIVESASKLSRSVDEGGQFLGNIGDDIAGGLTRRPKGEYLSNEQLISQAAIRAERKKGGIAGSDMEVGRIKHQYAERFLRKYQASFSNRGLEVEKHFSTVHGRGRLDVRDPASNRIYDFKFGKPEMSNKQFNKYSNSFKDHTIYIVDKYGTKIPRN